MNLRKTLEENLHAMQIFFSRQFCGQKKWRAQRCDKPSFGHQNESEKRRAVAVRSTSITVEKIKIRAA
ncbi:MAG TPA: hypothetical protein PLA87_24220 [Pseudomonadota bacterium]|nr:hypothetical protein [Pseudomonadota bacterium]